MLRNKRNSFKLLQLLLLTVFLCTNIIIAQSPPPLPQREITVLPTQPIDFGVFVVSGAGTIEVDYQGIVTTTGGVISINTTSVTPAIFEIKLCQGRSVTIDYDEYVWLDGSNGGQLKLIIGPTERGVSGVEFPVDFNCDFITVLRVGGKLDVPANAVPGVYTGSFPMTFTQE
jgi:hypothetical protein